MAKNIFTLLIIACASLIAPHLQASNPVVEYRFNAGEELIYELISREYLLEDPEKVKKRRETKARWNVYPIRQSEDGSWRLVVRTSVKLLRYDREETVDDQLGEWKKEPHVRFENTFLGYCDLMPSGAYKTNSTLGQSYLFELLPELLFVPLPHPDSQGKGKPTPKIAPTSGTKYSLSVQSANEVEVKLTGPLVRTLSANYESTNTLEIDFDAKAGRVKQIIETNKSDWKDHPSHTRTTYELTKVVQHPSEWMERFETAANSYFTDRDAWWEHKLQATKLRTKEECQKLVDDARKRLVDAQQNIKFAEVRAAYDGLVALHDREVEWDIEAAAEREELYAKPPVDWMSTDLNGTLRRRADYDGKIVILDFWYRGCGHCILALPKVKALHETYKDRGVVVLGVNNDSDLEDAQHVVDTYSIPYKSVRNVLTPIAKHDPEEADSEESSEKSEKRISSEYKVDSWPTFIVLDQNGRIAEVVGGNAEDLVEHLSEVVDGLLKTSDGT